jgi:GNAT superfamily N-acetyltransferase
VSGVVRSVVELTEAQVPQAGGLLAARHAGERRRFPLLPAAYEDPERAAGLVRGMLSFSDSVAALDDRGDVVGFLTSFESAPEPSSPMARYSPERSALHLVQGHAVSGRADSARVYPALYAQLAARAVDRGITDHVVHVPIGHPATETAWVALGFGRVNVVAVRDLGAVDRPLPSDVDVRLAGSDELDIVERLVDEESVFHAGSPIFRPYVGAATAAAVRIELADALASDDHAFLVARRGGADVGVISVGPGVGSPLYVPDGAVYIAATAVLPAARGSGAGAALVEAALSWSRDHGHRAACLHFASANATSTSFWTGIGFTPVMAHVRRRLDERILVDRPPHPT